MRALHILQYSLSTNSPDADIKTLVRLSVCHTHPSIQPIRRYDTTDITYTE